MAAAYSINTAQKRDGRERTERRLILSSSLESERISAGPILVPGAGGNLWIESSCDSAEAPTVLIVDHEDLNGAVLHALLTADGYRVITTRLAGEALTALEQAPIDLVIAESGLPGGACFELCRAIRANQRMALTPVILLSSTYSVEREIAFMGAGADAFLGGPLHPELLRARVRSVVRHKAVVDRMEGSEAILMSLAQAVEHRDNITGGHCDRLAALAVALGMAMDLPPDHLLALHRGGYLHDIGKIGIPDSILFKNGPLSEEEWHVMRTHTTKGEDICRPMKCLRPVLPIIRSHHERWDGSGYPDGLRGEGIPLLARVLHMVDIYDALTSARSYKPAIISSDALRIMQEETDQGWHDPEIMRLFLRFRHEEIRRAAYDCGEQWQDVEVMKQSLKNLQDILRRG